VVVRFLLPPSLGAAKSEARAELCAAALSRELGVAVDASVAVDYAELEAAARGGRADLLWMPSAVCARIPSVAALFTIVRDGRTSYRSALIGRREDKLSLGTLSGRRAAWVDPLSAGGHLLAVALLRARGVEPDRTFASQTFVGSHRAAALAVLHREADVAAVTAHGIDEITLAADLRWYVGAGGDQLEAFALSDRCPNDAIVVTDHAPPQVLARFREVFVGTPTAGAAALFSALEAEGLAPGGLAIYRAAFGARRATTRPPGP
jgi:phosphate/phosphite/phosphonate ABC transporter binding protein